MTFKRALLKFAVISIRIFLGLLFFTSGMSKLTNNHFFSYTFFPGSLEIILEPYGLGLLGRFVAWAEIFVGLLLFSQRFATLGAIMLVPLLANILVITTSLGWQGTPYAVAFMLALNVFLLAADYRKLKFLFFDDLSDVPRTPLRRTHAQSDLLWLAGMTACLAGGAFYPTSRLLMYILISLGILMFLGGALWQIFDLRRKASQVE